MTVKFKVASCAPPAGGAGAPSRVVLPGEIAGMDVHAHCVGPAAPLAVPRRPGRLGVFLATGGAGSLAVAGAEYAVDEVAVLVPPPDYTEVVLTCAAGAGAAGPLCVLELSLELDAEDRRELAGRAEPFFARYSECPVYQQSFKSAKSTSRFIVPGGTVPRLAMGSVQAPGPDEVGLHKHPMLDQLFFGLPGTTTKVVADGVECTLRGHELMHIPLGSEHGASVGAGDELHYIWIDRYIDRELCAAWFARDHEEGAAEEVAVEYPNPERVHVGATKLEMAATAAAFVAAQVRGAVARHGAARVIFATGASQFEFIEALLAIPGLPWDRVTCFHLDEYCGISAEHPASFRKYLRERLFSKLAPPPAAVHLVDPDAIDAYDALLLEGDIHLACIGIGENGHIAFNDPPVADFDDPKLVKVVELDEPCRLQQVGEGWFESLETTPTHAVTLTVPAIMRARVISCLVPDERKAVAVRDALCGEISTKCPASVLRRHRNAVFWLDPDSVSLTPSGQRRLALENGASS